jgi:hypothetical protein
MKLILKRLVFLAVSISLTIFRLLIFKNESKELHDESSKCENLRKPVDVLVDNVVWQVLETAEGRVNLLNAYLDERFGRTVVRINANGPNINKTYDNIYCQFWFQDEKPLIMKVSKYRSLWIGRLTREFY